MRRGNRQRGFTLVEAMIAGGIMMVVMLGVYELITNANKSAGDLEKRLRFRDLLDDIRFTLGQPALCHDSFHPASWADDAEAELDLGDKTTVKTGASLPTYGVKITRFAIRGVRVLPPSPRVVFNISGLVLAEFQEESRIADLYIEASTLGTNHALKPTKVARLIDYKRSGGISEVGCVGSHEVLGRAVAVESPRAMENAARITDAMLDASSVKPKGIHDNRSDKDCAIDQEEVRQRTGRNRLVQGEVLRFKDANNFTIEVTCENGTLSAGIISEGD